MSLAIKLCRAAVLASLPIVLLAALAPYLRVPVSAALAIGFASAATAVLLAIAWIPLEALKPAQSWISALAIGVATTLCGLLVARTLHHSVADVASGLLNSIGAIWIGAALGAAVGNRIIDPGHLLAVALASSAADIWSVRAPHGIARAVVELPDVALQRLFAVSAAIAPQRMPVAAVGMGDVIFAALYVTAASRHDLGRRRILSAIAVGLAIAGACAFAFLRAMPALPFLGIAVLVVEPKARRVKPGDRSLTVMAGVLVVAALLQTWSAR